MISCSRSVVVLSMHSRGMKFLILVDFKEHLSVTASGIYLCIAAKMVIMRQTAPKRFPLRKCAKRVSPWKNFEILVHVFSSDLHKKHTYYEGISKTIMMQYVLCIIKV